MHLEVTFKNLRPRDEVRQRAAALFGKLERFLDPASAGQLVVAVEHGQAEIELVLRAGGEIHTVSETHAELRTAHAAAASPGPDRPFFLTSLAPAPSAHSPPVTLA